MLQPGRWDIARFLLVDEDALTRVAPGLVLAGWGRPVRAVSPLGGGMNSATALVDLGDQRAVLKWVRDTSAGAFEAGTPTDFNPRPHIGSSESH